MNLAETNFPLLIVRDFLNTNELENVWKELDDLNKFMTLPDTLSASYKEDGKIKKNNKACWPVMIYGPNNSTSITLNLYKKIFEKSFIEKAQSLHWFFKYMSNVTKDAVLINLYENGDSYKSHNDVCTITSLIWLWREPKAFTGGDMIFDDTYHFPISNNTLIMFPSCINHEVTEVKMDDKPGHGRYAITLFSHIV